MIGKRTWNDLFLVKTLQSLFQYLVCWHKYAQYIILPDDWGNPDPWYFWELFSVFIKHWMTIQQNNKQLVWRWKWRQVSQNSSGLFRQKKIGWDNINLRYIYIEITQAIYFHIFYHRCREYLKPSANFANFLSEFSSRILANTGFHLNWEWNFANLFHQLFISLSNDRD